MGFWHSKEGRYRLYTDKERKEYGERKREEMSKAWHAKYISKWKLLNERGWTKKAIEEFLKKPATDYPTVAYYRYLIERIEKGKRFREFMEKNPKRKKLATHDVDGHPVDGHSV